MSDQMLALWTLGPTVLVLLAIAFGIRGFRRWRAKDLSIRDRERDQNRPVDP